VTVGAALFIDFDGTISPVDISNTFFSRFAGRDAIDAVAEWKQGLISSTECLKREIDAYSGNLEDLRAYARCQPIDPGFFALQGACREKGIDLIVVSDGLDFYIEPFLEAHKARVDFRSNRLEIRNGERLLSFPHYRESCGTCANCKSSHVEQAAAQGKMVIYVGDGLSDKCAVSRADVVFAKGELAEYCEREGIPHVVFGDLEQVAQYVRSSVSDAKTGTA
jgi:2-hydroxy-3-keto-5-methylthiopentenyl-1-phosphate phosphatase